MRMSLDYLKEARELVELPEHLDPDILAGAEFRCYMRDMFAVPNWDCYDCCMIAVSEFGQVLVFNMYLGSETIADLFSF